MGPVLGTIASLLLLSIARFIYNLIKNVSTALSVGVPLIFVPVDQANLLWLILSPPNRRRLQKFLPARLWERMSLSIVGWEFHEKKRPFDQLANRKHGDETSRTFLLVGLRRFDLWTADPKAVGDIVLRIHDFVVPDSMGAVLGRFGPNVLTTNGDQWARHRKIVASVINERISKAVFEHSLRHSHDILSQVLPTPSDKAGSTDTTLLFDLLTKITLNVLIGTGLGDKVPWKLEEERRPEPGYTMTYTESLGTVVDNVLGVGILPLKLLTRWPSWVPGHVLMTTVGRAMAEVRKRNQSLLGQERDRIMKGETSESPQHDLMSNLVRASRDGSISGMSLSEDEMISNMFVFTAGGFKTTAATLAYAVVLLARLPQWQDWLLEEVDSLTSASGTEPLEYPTTFQKAVRIMAFVMETMRLYGGSSRLFRNTASAQTLHTSSGTIHVPAGTSVYVNSVVLHRLPSWRDLNRQSDPSFCKPDPNTPDEEVFRPSRWLNPPGSAHAHFRPEKGTFTAWSGGPRICPGQKMAQIEFMGVMLTLLRRHRIQAVPLEGEDHDDINRRLDARLQDSDSTVVMVMNGIYNPKEGEGLSIRISQRR